jgi:hypothetical protein
MRTRERSAWSQSRMNLCSYHKSADPVAPSCIACTLTATPQWRSSDFCNQSKFDAELLEIASAQILSALSFTKMGYHAGQQAFFLPAGGIDPEVIGADIGLYVGRNAQVQLDQVRLDKFSDRRRLTSGSQSRRGYLIHASNRLTTVCNIVSALVIEGA